MLSIDSLPVPGLPGLLGLSRCPGSDFMQVLARDRALRSDLSAIQGWGAAGVLTLNEGGELAMLGLDNLGEAVEDSGMAWWHCPIPDFAAPGPRFEETWQTVGPAVYRLLGEGERVLLHCLAGLGRTGTVAARILIEQGLDPEEALSRVRQARPGAVQSEEQWQYLLACRPGGI